VEDNSIDIISRMNERFMKMSKSHKAIAAFISDHYDEAAFMTAAKIGAKVNTSESTVVRFAMSLGYSGYPEFQKALAEWVQSKLNRVQKVSAKYKNNSESEIISSVMNADIDKLHDTLTNLDPVSFKESVDIILEAKTVYVIGLRSCEPLADFLQFYLQMIRGNIVLLKTTSVTETFEQMIRINEKDCIIGISFPRYSMRTLKALEFANDRRAKIITITDSIHSPLNLYSHCNLLARSDMVSIVDSLVAPLSVINSLVVALCLKAPDAVKKNLETLEEVWNNYQVYLNDEINFIDEEPMLNYPLMKKNEEETS